MSTIRRFRTAIPAYVTMLTFALSAPITVNAEEQVLVLAPDAGTSWDEASGYRSVEASRAETAEYVGPAASMTAGATSVFGAGEANRVLIAQHALQVGDLGSLQEEALLAVVAVAMTGDETSRATTLPAASTTAEANRVIAAQQALLSHELGSMQEDALTAVVAAAMTGDETSSYGAVEASRTEH